MIYFTENKREEKMEKEVVDEKNEITNNNDANKFEEVETYQ